MRGRVPPHSFVDVDVVDKESNQVTEEQLELKQDAPLNGQLWNLAVTEGNHCLGCQRGAGKTRS